MTRTPRPGLAALFVLLAACAPAGPDPGLVPADAAAAVPPADAAAPIPADAAVAPSVSYTLPFRTANTIDQSFRLRVSVGGGPAHSVVMDTGSTGLVVPRSALGPDAQVTADPFRLEYISSGIIESGHWGVARVRVGVPANFDPANPGQTAITVPMRFGVVESVTCDPNIAGCMTSGNPDNVGMMGVGFDRDSANFPASLNVFLQLSEIGAGTMHAGYIVLQHPPQVIVGLTPANMAGFQMLPLDPKPNVPGEWDAGSLHACVTLPGLPAFGTPCGSLLVDTGIAGGILTTPSAMRPRALATQDPGRLDPGVRVIIGIGGPNPLFTYDFTLGQTDPATPGYMLLRTSTDGKIHVNTSRHLLATQDYLFDARDGRVGFRAP